MERACNSSHMSFLRPRGGILMRRRGRAFEHTAAAAGSALDIQQEGVRSQRMCEKGARSFDRPPAWIDRGNTTRPLPGSSHRGLWRAGYSTTTHPETRTGRCAQVRAAVPRPMLTHEQIGDVMEKISKLQNLHCHGNPEATHMCHLLDMMSYRSSCP